MDAKQSALIELEDYNRWCLDNERPGDLSSNLIKYCKEFNVADDVYYEMCALIEPADLCYDCGNENSDCVSQDEIDARINDDSEDDLLYKDILDESVQKRMREHNDKDKIEALSKYVDIFADGIEESDHDTHTYKSSKGSYSIVTAEEAEDLNYNFEDAEAKQGNYYFFKK